MAPIRLLSTPPTSSQSDLQDVASLKRRLCALEIENAQLLTKILKKPILSFSREGRAIRRLVTLVEPISDMIAEYDRRQLLMAEEQDSAEAIQASPEQQRTYNNYQRLVECCPSLTKLMEAGTADLITCREFQAGADAARGDDAATLKGMITLWLTLSSERGHSLHPPQDKKWRGFNHDVTGGLLCPVDYDWSDSNVRNSIREYHPDFQVMAYSWPSFLYPQGEYDATNPSKGLFQGVLLVKAFKCIFTSPTSARHSDYQDQTSVRYQVPRARTNVAALLWMKNVQPRAIAYVAVQARYALSSCSSWAVIDDDFNYEHFYNNIVDYFEAPSTPEKAVEIKALLLWWNRRVFGRRNVANYHPLQAETLSVARSRK